MHEKGNDKSKIYKYLRRVTHRSLFSDLSDPSLGHFFDIFSYLMYNRLDGIFIE